MRVLIVDDEAPARRRLATLLEELGAEVIGEAADGVTALRLVRERGCDLLLLDVAMPEVDGFDVARHLPEPRPLIVFQTAYSEFAAAAFEHEALDYVVKPVTRERLAQALDRAARRLASQTVAGWSASTLDRVGAAMGHASARPARVLVRHGASHRLIELARIERFNAADGLVYAHSDDGIHGTDYTLQSLESRLTGAFVRVSRADLVSLAATAAIASNGDGSATLTLRSGTTVHVSRRRAAAVWTLLGGDPAVHPQS